jgi:hypothetical protein
MHVLLAAGPRPAPLPWPTRLVVLAWLQLGAVVLASVYGALMVAWFLSPGWADLTCLDRARPACETHVPTAALVAMAGMQLLAVAASMATVAIARRHRRGRARRSTASAAMAASFGLTVAVEALLLYA